MPKVSTDRMSAEEFASAPLLLSTAETARVLGVNARYVSRNAAKFGGVKVAGKYAFPKSRVAAMLGLD